MGYPVDFYVIVGELERWITPLLHQVNSLPEIGVKRKEENCFSYRHFSSKMSTSVHFKVFL
jgi:hypothetical protein